MAELKRYRIRKFGRPFFFTNNVCAPPTTGSGCLIPVVGLLVLGVSVATYGLKGLIIYMIATLAVMAFFTWYSERHHYSLLLEPHGLRISANFVNPGRSQFVPPEFIPYDSIRSIDVYDDSWLCTEGGTER
jgi:hypothetical protein